MCVEELRFIYAVNNSTMCGDKVVHGFWKVVGGGGQERHVRGRELSMMQLLDPPLVERVGPRLATQSNAGISKCGLHKR